jgi:hypothetical protein
VLETEEDRAEWARHEREVNLLSAELGLISAPAAATTAATPPAAAAQPRTDSQGDVEMVRFSLLLFLFF